jgi:hypothetical protein
MSAAKSVEELFEELGILVGNWRGRGSGQFPTIEAFRYLEETAFTENPGEMLVHFEQKSWLLDEGDNIVKPLHWEGGFFIPAEDGRIDILNAQNSRRVEVLRGESRVEDGCWFFRAGSVLHGYDPRMAGTTREFEVSGDVLRYRICMATDKVGEIQPHLEAELKRVGLHKPARK